MYTEVSHPEIQLSLEELALMLNLMGYPIIAKGLLNSMLGDISVEEERGRLLAANHTLLAKNIMTLNEGELHIDSTYADLLALLPDNDRAVRCVVSSEDGAPRMLTYYVRGDQIVQQRIAYGAVHSFHGIPSTAEAAKAIFALLELETIQPHSRGAFQFPYASLEVLTETERDAAGASERLQVAGWAKETADSFAQDLFNPRWRGSVYRVEMNPERGMPPETGFMMLTSNSDRAWFMTFSADTESDLVLIEPATRDLVRDSTMALLGPL